ncbi:MAG: tetratricopeptide repeat protein [Flavobacteriales bacterium]|nr:tetratricopeptide repeat protein [Flavobacteriales bacterium]
MDKGNISEAADLYEKLSQKEPNNALFLETLGDCMSKLNNTSKAVEYLEKANSLVSDPSMESKLMNAYMKNGEFMKAMDIANKKIKGEPKGDTRSLKKVISTCKVGQTLTAHPLNIEIENLGSSINSKEDDILPFSTADGDLLVFSSNRKSVQGKKQANGNKPFEVFIANKDNEKLKSLRTIESPVNTSKTDIALGLSSKSEMIFVFNGSSISAGNMNSYSNTSGKFISALENYENLKGYDLTNGITISQDLQEMYFSSDHESSLGGKDIYVSRKLPDGEWSEPINLGENINTEKDETFPQLAQYDNYMYFSSDGHPGMGERDLFRSKKDKNEWKSPKNLGYPLSTPLDDKNITLNEKGNAGYFSSVGEDSFGGYDIYSFEYKEATLKHAVMLVYLRDDEGNAITSVPMVVTDELGDVVGTFYANSNTRRYTLALKPGTYELSLKENGYENYFEKIEVTTENLNKFNNEIRLQVSQ